MNLPINQHKHTSKTLTKAALISSAISLLLSASSVSYAETALHEQCAGIVKAGLNDCASAEHVCAGMNTDDGYKSDWVWLPVGTCKKISGGEVIGTGDPNK